MRAFIIFQGFTSVGNDPTSFSLIYLHTLILCIVLVNVSDRHDGVLVGTSVFWRNLELGRDMTMHVEIIRISKPIFVLIWFNSMLQHTQER